MLTEQLLECSDTPDVNVSEIMKITLIKVPDLL